MIGGFGLIIYGGPLALMLTTFLVQVKVRVWVSPVFRIRIQTCRSWTGCNYGWVDIYYDRLLPRKSTEDRHKLPYCCSKIISLAFFENLEANSFTRLSSSKENSYG
jgi:hypothetical protein